MYVERAIGTLLVAALLASREARAARSESQDKAPVTVGALLESLRGRVWHDEAPLAEVSFRMTCIMEYLGSGGEVTRTVVLEHRRWFSRGRMQEELVSARENGQDVTERERRKEAGADDHRRGSASRWSLDETLAPPLPFLAPGGARYRLGLEAGKGTRLVYHPAEATELRVASGWVELDAADGLPLRHQFVPAPLPKMIHSLVTTVSYRRSAGMALPESTESVGEGGFLFIRKRFRVRMTYRDWELAPLR